MLYASDLVLIRIKKTGDVYLNKDVSNPSCGENRTEYQFLTEASMDMAKWLVKNKLAVWAYGDEPKPKVCKECGQAILGCEE